MITIKEPAVNSDYNESLDDILYKSNPYDFYLNQNHLLPVHGIDKLYKKLFSFNFPHIHSPSIVWLRRKVKQCPKDFEYLYLFKNLK